MQPSRKREWPAPARNRGPILEALRPRLAHARSVLEVASGTGQHATYFARHLAKTEWQPTEVDPELLASIEAWREEAALPNLRAPLPLDVSAEDWKLGRFDAIYNANMIHIAPWSVAESLLAHAPRHLSPGGSLFLYGPFFVDGEEPAPSNVSFDASLRAQDASFGVRDLGTVQSEAARHGFLPVERVAMPANNLLVWLRLGAARSAG